MSENELRGIASCVGRNETILCLYGHSIIFGVQYTEKTRRQSLLAMRWQVHLAFRDTVRYTGAHLSYQIPTPLNGYKR